MLTSPVTVQNPVPNSLPRLFKKIVKQKTAVRQYKYSIIPRVIHVPYEIKQTEQKDHCRNDNPFSSDWIFYFRNGIASQLLCFQHFQKPRYEQYLRQGKIIPDTRYLRHEAAEHIQEETHCAKLYVHGQPS